MALYSEKVMDHFRNPRNVGVIEIANVVSDTARMATAITARTMAPIFMAATSLHREHEAPGVVAAPAEALQDPAGHIQNSFELGSSGAGERPLDDAIFKGDLDLCALRRRPGRIPGGSRGTCPRRCTRRSTRSAAPSRRADRG